jgi:excisionase family DNA binding protein
MKAPIDRFTRVEDLPELVSVDEVATWMGVSPWLLYEAIKRDELACARLGRRVLIPRRALEKLAGREAEEATRS